MSVARRHLILLLLLLPFTGALAIDDELPFDDSVLNERYMALVREVRCLVCQNQSIADSNAALAADLRREIANLLADGQSDREVVNFLTARYGDFVMYRPPVKPLTWPLWGGPTFLLLLGSAIFVRTVRRRNAAVD